MNLCNIHFHVNAKHKPLTLFTFFLSPLFPAAFLIFINKIKINFISLLDNLRAPRYIFIFYILYIAEKITLSQKG